MTRTLALGVSGAVLSLLLATGIGPAQAGPPTASVSHLSGPVLSPRLSDLPAAPSAGTLHAPKLAPAPKGSPHTLHGFPNGGDGALQSEAGEGSHIEPTGNFPGIGASGYIPGDPNIAVGKSQIVQVVNSQVAVFDKSTGAMLAGYPKSLSSLFTGLAGCQSSNAGDPIVQYDNLADNGGGRWLITELGSTSGPFSECIAVSTSNNPAGTYYLYADTQFGSTLNDYPKFGVWPTATNSAYLATYNLFANGQTFAGGMLCAYDRNSMLNGLGAPAICYTLANDGNYLPADLDGATPPVDLTPGYFLNFETSATLRLYQLSPNFSGPSPAGTLTLVTPDLAVAPFSQACGGGTCIGQPNNQRLDSLGDRLMYRLAYRVLSGTPTMVVNHSVAAGSSVGVRWYELQASGGVFSVTQQGTYAPDAAYRWMGSAAMDGAGDIALGYSLSSNSIYPGLAYTGRTPGMPLNTMGTETVLQAGAGAQTTYSRWGDYSALRIDPSDDTTFWYTNEYYTSNNPFFNYVWSTAIGSFKVVASAPPPPPPDFAWVSPPTSLTVNRGSTGTAIVQVSGINASSSVTLSIGPLPSRVGASFSPNPVTAPLSGTGSSTLTINVNRRALSGTYGMTITGKNGSNTHTTPFTLRIQ